MQTNKKLIIVFGTFVSLVICSSCTTITDKKEISLQSNEKYEIALKGKGTPTVIFEAGLNDSMHVWGEVFDTTSSFTTAYAYSRKGNKRPDPLLSSLDYVLTNIFDNAFPAIAETLDILEAIDSISTEITPKTGEELLKELRQILKQEKINPPYILVGHDIGGLYMLLFAKKYPEEVSGVILIESLDCKILEDEKKNNNPSSSEEAGIYETKIQIKKAGEFPSVPLIILSRGTPLFFNSKKEEDCWTNGQLNLTTLSPSAKHIISKKSTHYIQYDDPDLIIKTIQQMFNPDK